MTSPLEGFHCLAACLRGDKNHRWNFLSGPPGVRTRFSPGFHMESQTSGVPEICLHPLCMAASSIWKRLLSGGFHTSLTASHISTRMTPFQRHFFWQKRSLSTSSSSLIPFSDSWLMQVLVFITNDRVVPYTLTSYNTTPMGIFTALCVSTCI